jgi:hypothetical protein
MKFELQRLQKGSSEEKIRNEIMRVAALIPEEIITGKKFDELSKISSSYLKKRFGGWQNTLNQYNLGHRYSGRNVSEKMTKQVAKYLSNEELITELKRIAILLQKEEFRSLGFSVA